MGASSNHAVGVLSQRAHAREAKARRRRGRSSRRCSGSRGGRGCGRLGHGTVPQPAPVVDVSLGAVLTASAGRSGSCLFTALQQLLSALQTAGLVASGRCRATSCSGSGVIGGHCVHRRALCHPHILRQRANNRLRRRCGRGGGGRAFGSRRASTGGNRSSSISRRPGSRRRRCCCCVCPWRQGPRRRKHYVVASPRRVGVGDKRDVLQSGGRKASSASSRCSSISSSGRQRQLQARGGCGCRCWAGSGGDHRQR